MRTRMNDKDIEDVIKRLSEDSIQYENLDLLVDWVAYRGADDVFRQQNKQLIKSLIIKHKQVVELLELYERIPDYADLYSRIPDSDE